MNSLSLYIDKWFISVAINIDGKVMPLSLPNREDRIWLFFHEDIANSRIEYGKVFENDFRDKIPHYFGDIFTLIGEEDHHFTLYGGRPQEMKKIFKASGIFNHLHQAIGKDDTIDTYISFSSDITDLARLRFIEELQEDHFKVVESVARISHLSLEECKQRNIFSEQGFYLVLTATNDNFHYSLYENKGNIFLRKNESSLVGLGLDVRRRALVETIVENINKNSKWLKTQEEIEQEYVRQNRFASEWLEQIDKSKTYMPVAFNGITFAIAPNNPEIVQIFPNKLNERTTAIVDDIVCKIADFIKDNQLRPYEIQGIVFIGNTFINQTFAKAINNRFILNNDKMVSYREEDLPQIVSVYSQIDCSQFREATSSFVNDAQTQAELNRRAKEEAEKKRKAEEMDRRQKELIDSQKEAEQQYKTAIENIDRYESEHNYEEMLEWVGIALTNRPEDEFAKEKAALAQQLLAEQRAANKQYSTVLQRAQTAFAEERWSDAVSQSEMALELRPDSDEALRLKKESHRRMEIKGRVNNFLNRADLFFAQRLYQEATEEIEKVKSLDPDNTGASAIQRKIATAMAKHQETINALMNRLNEASKNLNFPEARKICEQLIEEDVANISKWMGRIERINSQAKELETKKKNLETIKNDINQALFDENWNKLIILCENYLAIESDREISQILAKARKKIEKEKAKDARDKKISLINSLIIDGKTNEAEKELNRFSQDYPSDQALVKDLRRKIFSIDNIQDKKEVSLHRAPIGFKSIGVSRKKVSDDFLGSLSNPDKKKIPTKSQEKMPKSKDDFFDSVSTVTTSTKQARPTLHNEDFNF